MALCSGKHRNEIWMSVHRINFIMVGLGGRRGLVCVCVEGGGDNQIMPLCDRYCRTADSRGSSNATLRCRPAHKSCVRIITARYCLSGPLPDRGSQSGKMTLLDSSGP
ncbi:hypothetical protein PoB_007473300 [Plakobranchus ocellatus]|uniref:Uncharacterized protein n=1 Tax=Plakobranchus ocellatus TaxID=259542 RepID=A0AAV4DVD1_9GAST|nr:hypothetical protein PoB_007473300 [Plakobranchus ocellatus]